MQRASAYTHIIGLLLSAVVMSFQTPGILPFVSGVAAASVTSECPLDHCVFVAFDTETTGLSAITSRLVEIAGVKFTLRRGEITTYRALINPEIHIPSAATRVHGITDRMVQNAPTYQSVVPDFINWATDAESWSLPEQHHAQTVFLAHNAGFDLSFLEVALCRLRMSVPHNVVLDTLSLARKLIQDSPNYQLKTLIETLDLPKGGYHRALADSYHVQNLFKQICEKFARGSAIADVANVGGKLHFVDRSQDDTASFWQDSAEVSTIRKAINIGQRLLLQYAATKGSQRLVTPTSILFVRGKPYLTAFCHRVSAERTFRIDKITRMETLD